MNIVRSMGVALTVLALVGSNAYGAEKEKKNKQNKQKKEKQAAQQVDLKIKVEEAKALEGASSGDPTATFVAYVTITNNEKTPIVVSQKSIKVALRDSSGGKVEKLTKDNEKLLDAYQLPAGETTKNPVKIPLTLTMTAVKPGSSYKLICRAYGQRANATVTFEK